MNTASTQNKNHLTIYACGGAATEIVGPLEAALAKTNSDYRAETTCYYLDTSLANIRNNKAGIDPTSDNVYITRGVDGSGGLRMENHEKIKEEIPLILDKCRSGDYNIVIASTSGGSGSVIAPGIARALLQRDKVVVVIIIGDTRAKKEAENTVSTIKTYFGIADRLDKCLVGVYLENGREGTIPEVNNLVRNYISTLAVLFSGRNHALDTRDVYNFFNFNKVSDREPGFAGLLITTERSPKEASRGVIGCIAIGSNPDNDRPDLALDYFKHGGIPEDELEYEFLRFYVEDVSMFDALDNAEQREKELKDNLGSRPTHRRKIDLGNADDDGFVM